MSDSGYHHIADRIEGVPLPFQQSQLTGHDDALDQFLSGVRLGRLHHAWLVTGNQGIGKSTFSYICARYLLADIHTRVDAGELIEKTPLSRAVEQDAHPNVFTLRRGLNKTGKGFATKISVDSVRKANQFFESTPANEGWRIIIVDAADDMNVQSANALLKSLEEPPKRAVFFLISHRPGSLLPTIKSRCRHIALKNLSVTDTASVLRRISDVPEDVLLKAAEFGEGSARQALTFARPEAIALRNAVERVFRTDTPSHGEKATIANLVLSYGDGGFQLFADILARYMEDKARGISSTDIAFAKKTANHWSTVQEMSRETEIYNLDKRDAVFAMLGLIE